MSRAASEGESRASYRYGPACIEVTTGDRDAGRWLREFLAPWFSLGSPGENPLRVRLTCSAPAFAALERRKAEASTLPYACFALDRQVIELSGWQQAAEIVIADPERSCFYRVRPGDVEIVAQPGGAGVRVGLMRVIREFAAARMLAQPGLLDLHAAAFTVAGRAVLLVGPKQSGKTTLLVDALASGRSKLLANDRVFVDTRAEPGRAFGVPTLVSLRAGTLRWFPSLPQGFPARPALLHASELAQQIEATQDAAAPLHLTLSPGQLAQRLGAGIATSAPIAAILFPVIAPTTARWSLERVSHDEGATWLRESLYGIAADPRSRTVFEAAALAPDCGQPARATLADRLASQIPLFRFRLGRHAYRDGAEPWLRELPLELARKRRVA